MPSIKDSRDKGPGQLSARSRCGAVQGPELTSPLGVVTAVLRGSMSSLMLDRKFWEIRRASWSSG